jgi:hypothetical protein
LKVPGLEKANIPPIASEDRIKLTKLKRDESPTGLFKTEIEVLRNDSDADSDELSVENFTGPRHGYLAFDPSSQRFTYSTVSPQADEFTYTVSDGKGGKAIGRVFLEPKLNPTFSGALSNAEGAAVTMKLTITPGGKVGGRLLINEKEHRFTGRVNILGTAFSRVEDGEDAWVVELRTVVDGQNWYVSANVVGEESVYTGVCVPEKFNSSVR